VSSAEQWNKLESLFAELADASPEDQLARLTAIGTEDPQLRERLEALLRSDNPSQDALQAAVGNAAESLLSHQKDPLIGTVLGSYRITAVVGQGGMSVVYRAERNDSRHPQVVAIKVLHQVALHPRLRSRLHSERHILATLDHPSIARLIDSGELPSGTPYLSMEFVDGEAIDAFCERRGSSITERLQLFIKVCAAVQYAHRNLVVHRDIKAGNILVTRDGTPKLLDFGIAKLLATEGLSHTLPVTMMHERILTPENAAPEQILGRPITTATDVYALGVLLYQLLAGRSPYRLTSYSQLQLERAICMDDPLRPSQAARTQIGRTQASLSGDLDAIVAMAMRKEPERRYASVQAFADDVQKYLTGQPVIARQGDWRYHGGKFVRRHYLAVVGFGAILIGLAVMTSVTMWQNRRIEAARAATAQERDRAQQVSGFLIDVFSQADPFTAQGHEMTAKELLDQGADKIDRNVNLQPEVHAQLLESIGLAYRRSGYSERAIGLLETALAIRRDEKPMDTRRVAAGLANVATALAEAGRLQSAEDDLTEALAISRSGGKQNDAETADILVQFGQMALNRQSQPEKALEFFNEALNIDRGLKDRHPLAEMDALHGLSSAASWKGDYRLAERYERESLRLARSNLSHDHPDRSAALSALGVTLAHLGQFAESESLLNEALEIEVRDFGQNSDRPALTESDLATLYDLRGEPARAAATLKDALKITIQQRGEEHFRTGFLLEGLAIEQLQLDDLDAAEANVRKALQIYSKTLPPVHLYVAASRRVLGEILLRRGDFAAAETEMRAAVDISRELMGRGKWPTAKAEAGLGWTLIKGDKAAEGEPLLASAQNLLMTTLGPNDPSTRTATQRLVEYYRSRKRDADAERVLAGASAR
jgi:tetratricopeptide (TPR) repeat protein